MIKSGRIAAAACAVLLMFSACGARPDPAPASSSADGAGTKMGRFTEEEIALPSDIKRVVGIGARADGSLAMLALGPDNETPMYLTSADDGNTWEKAEAPFLAALVGAEISSIDFDTRGDAYILYKTYTPEISALIKEKEAANEELSPSEFPGPEVMKVGADGTFAAVPLQWGFSESEYNFPSELKVAPNGDLVFNYGVNLRQYGAETGELKNKYEVTTQIFRYAFYGNIVAAATYESGGKLTRFDLETGETLDPIDFSTEESVSLMTDSSGNGLLYSDKSGLWRLDGETNTWGNVMDGASTSLNMPTVFLQSLLEQKNGDWLALCQISDSYKAAYTLVRFHYDEGMPAVPEKGIAVFALHDNETIRQVAGVFQRRRQDVKVNMSVAIDGVSAITESDAIRTLNTELLAGKGPDVLVLDALPISSYMEKGVLADLSASVAMDSLIQNVAKTYKKGEQLFAVPTRFGVPVLWGSNASIAQAKDLSSLAGWAAENSGAPIFDEMEPKALIKQFYPTCAPAWQNEDGSIREDTFAAFLTCIKTIADSGPKEEEDATRSDYVSNLEIQGIGWATGRIQLCADNSQSFGNMAYPDAAAQKLGDGGFALLPGQAKNVFVPQAILGVNTNSGAMAESLEFVATALDESVQSLDLKEGYPVNMAAFQKASANPYPEGEGGSVFGSTNKETGEMFTLEIRWPEEGTMRAISDAIISVDTPSSMDPVLMQMIVDESAEFFTGGITEVQAAQAVAQRAQAYLLE